MTITSHTIRLLLFVSFFWPFGVVAYAQNEPLDRPDVLDYFVTPAIEEEFYNIAEDSEEGDLNQLSRRSGHVWKVWCIQEGTPVVSSPGTTNRIGFLSFGKEVVVIELARRANSSGAQKNWLKILMRDGTTGWVRSSAMQISSWCLQTKTGVGRKGLMVPNLENGEQTNPDLSPTQLYSHPRVRRSDKINGKTAGRFRVLYILQETENAWLVSNSAKLVGGGGGTSSIRGWVPKSNMVEWDRRVAYGPAFSSTINDHFPDDKSIPLFGTRDDATHYFVHGDAQNTQGSIKILPPDGEQIPVVPAFPFIGKSTSNSDDPVRELLFVTGSSMTVSEDEIDTRLRIQALRNKLQKIHVYFIVDATASMRRYYEGIAKAINDFNAWSNTWNSGTDATMEVGFGVYRDYADAPNGRDTEFVPRQRFNQDLRDAIINMDCSSKNPKTPEAVYNGILKNIKSFDIDPQASNVIILIGDEGNHAVDQQGLLASDVADKLKELNTSLFIFQVNSFMTESSNRYQQDGLAWLKAIIPNNERLEYQSPGVIGTTQSSENLLGQREARMICPAVASGSQADPSVLVTEIRQYLDDWTTAVQVKINFLESILTGDPIERTPDELERDIQSLMKTTGLSYEKVKELLTRGGDKAYKRNVSIQRAEQPAGFDVLEPYVFLSFDEYNNISSSFTSLSLGGTIEAKKDALFDMCRNLILTQISPDELPEYEKKTMNEIWLEFFQVDFNIQALRDRPVNQIRGMGKDDGFEEAYDALVQASLTWDALNIEEREWIMGGNGKEQFFWVNASYFPGFAE